MDFIRYLVDTTADIFLKAFTGVVIFLVSDGILGGIFHFLCSYGGDKPKIIPFFLTIHLYGFIYKFFNDFKESHTLVMLSVYLIFWAWGKLIYILRQPLFFDFLKQSYTSKINDLDKGEYKTFEKLRSMVVDKLLNTELNDKWKELISENDYLLYQILGRKEKYLSASTKKRSLEADDIAFVATNAMLTSLMVVLGYFFFFIHLNCLNFSIILLLEVIITISFVMWSFFLSRIRKRYISRNTRLYINYLLEESSGKSS